MKSTNSVSILFIVPYPEGVSPGQRFRFEHYLPALESQGIKYQITPFIRPGFYKNFFQSSALRKIWIILIGYLHRLGLLFQIHKYSHLYVYRETSPIGPPLLLLLNKWIWKKPVIYDFDDAIWLRDEGGESSLVSAVKWKSKVGKICSWAALTNVGNNFLADYSRSQKGNPLVIPTVVNTVDHHKRTHPLAEELVIGWTGSHSTLPFLEPVIPVLRELRRKHAFEFRIIANRDPQYDDDFIKFVPWDKTREISDLEEFHIGLMPLSDTPWSKGKCGFKAIQYLALEIPAIVSPVGVNTEVVHHNVHGFHASSAEEWFEFLERLITTPELRKQMGQQGRRHIEENYSVSATEKSFVAMFR